VVRGVRAAPGAPVVVGVGGEQCEAALAAALHMAELLGVQLHVVHAWHVPLLATLAPSPLPAPELVYRGPDEAALLDAILAPLQARHPDVGVITRARAGGATQALVDASAEAGLVVLAGHGRGELSGLVLGSTSQDLIHSAGCPVMVVPPGVPAERC
jgi:nucleotide-binding universal stress UspA family protein